MNMRLTDHYRLPLTAAFAILVVLRSSSAVGANSDAMLFTGGAFGPTIDVAIQNAIEDAESTASAYQLFTCQLAAEPEIFPGPSSAFSRNFGAQVTVACTP